MPCAPSPYSLTGPQVEPDAGYWMFCPQLRMVSIKELLHVTDNPHDPGYFPPYPDPCTADGKAIVEKEIHELLDLQKHRDDPCRLVHPGKCPSLGPKPCEYVRELPHAFGCRAPISRLLNLQPLPLGAVAANRLPGQQVIRTGRGMARAVEAETPGLWHRHALNYLITTRSWSPPRQALVWAALDVALASALQAAWYYKWVSPRPLTSRRERPIEYALREGLPLHVLFDHPDELNPNYNLCPDAREFCDRRPSVSPGTPRHPAYPSGHSTYSGAASTILAFFFGQDATPGFLAGGAATTLGDELRHMADNIGMGRLWAGIHWRSDHEAGLKLGQVVACLVLKQLASICGGDFNLCPPQPPVIEDQCDCKQTIPCNMDQTPPPLAELEKRAERCRHGCPPCGESLDKVPDPCPPREMPKSASHLAPDLRSVQQGGHVGG